MLAFAIRRLLEAAFVMLTVALLAFVLFRFVGDPVNQMVGQDTSPGGPHASCARSSASDDPMPVQFGRFVWQRGTVRFRHLLSGEAAGDGDASPSAFRPPSSLPWRPPCLPSLLGIPMGVYTGIHRDSWLSKVFLTVSLIGISLPTFLIGILLIYVFAVKLGVLPSFGRGEVVRLGFWRPAC